jgi:hypothetical protein
MKIDGRNASLWWHHVMKKFECEISNEAAAIGVLEFIQILQDHVSR